MESRSLVSHFSEKTRHKSVCHWVVLPVDHLLPNLSIGLFFAAAERELEELFGSSLLGCLLEQDVGKEVFVALD